MFELENDQQWKVLKGAMKLRKPFDAPEIVVVPGIAGRWFLQVHEDLPKARVYRIDGSARRIARNASAASYALRHGMRRA